MYTAFVLVNTQLGSESDVLKQLKRTEGVREAQLTYGTYDIVLRVGFDTMEELKRIVTWRIRKLDKVTLTHTMIIQ